jgi:hypothetical protein
MKSQTDMLLQVAIGILKDCQLAYNGDRTFDRDIERLIILRQSRGIGLWTHLLPELSSALLLGLAHERLTTGFPLSRRRSPKSRLPAFLQGLWSRVFDDNLCLKDNADPNAVFFLQSFLTVGKKLELACSPKIIKKTIDEYEKIDNELQVPTLAWDEDSIGSEEEIHDLHFCDLVDIPDLPLFSNGQDLHARRESSSALSSLQAVCDYFAGSLGPFHPIPFVCEYKGSRESGLGFRHGPGAVSQKGGTVDKFHHTTWSRKLRGVFSPLFALPEKGANFGLLLNHELPSRLICVPKDARGPRLIASEPMEHQWCQQLILSFLQSRTKALWGDFITFENQKPSQEMAQRGSLDCSLATVDLSSASDRLSCWSIERFLRRNTSLLKAVHASRTRYIRNDVKGTDAFILKLRKFASQGTAVTFPMQSFFFLCCAISVQPGRTVAEKVKSAKGNVRVFGDDIVVPRESYVRLESLLHSLRLRVNPAKSYSTGHYRESCGGDFFKGANVTPIKIKHLDATTPEGRQSLLDACNNLMKVGLWQASEHLRVSSGIGFYSNPVMGPSSGSTGLYSFCGAKLDHLSKRWNPTLCRYEYKIRCFSSKESSGDRSGLSRLRMHILMRPGQSHMAKLFKPMSFSSDLLLRPKVRERLGWVPDAVLMPSGIDNTSVVTR